MIRVYLYRLVPRPVSPVSPVLPRTSCPDLLLYLFYPSATSVLSLLHPVPNTSPPSRMNS